MIDFSTFEFGRPRLTVEDVRAVCKAFNLSEEDAEDIIKDGNLKPERTSEPRWKRRSAK